MRKLQELAMDFIRRYGNNLYAENRTFNIDIENEDVCVESIRYSHKEDKIYIHYWCNKFEGDIDIDSLSYKNKKIVERELRLII